MNSEMLQVFKHRVCRPRILLGVGVVLTMVFMIGWMRSGSNQTAVKGRITYRGRLVMVGSVIVVDAKGQAVAVPITGDGSFQLKGVSRGPAQIAVVSPDPAAAQA